MKKFSLVKVKHVALVTFMLKFKSGGCAKLVSFMLLTDSSDASVETDVETYLSPRQAGSRWCFCQEMALFIVLLLIVFVFQLST